MKQITGILSPLRLILFVCRELLDRGYGGLRFYSYDDDGMGRIWVAMYFMMDLCQRTGEPLADSPFWIHRFVGFRDDPEWPSVFDDYLKRGLSVSQATTEFEQRYQNELRNSGAQAEPNYIEWYEGLLRLCRDDGFPLTEEPDSLGYGADGSMSKIIFSQASASPKLHSRPPAFASTAFPHREMLRQLGAKQADAKESQRKANYAEWKRRILEIDRRLKQ